MNAGVSTRPRGNWSRPRRAAALCASNSKFMPLKPVSFAIGHYAVFGRLAVWPFGRLAVWSFGRLVVWSFGRLVVWSFGRLVVWSVGWLVRSLGKRSAPGTINSMTTIPRMRAARLSRLRTWQPANQKTKEPKNQRTKEPNWHTGHMLTDLHCHMLPGIDDGSREMEQSLAMARIAVADGISTTVVTPHHLNGVYSNPAQRIRSGIEQLNDALQKAAIGLNILPGCELHLTPELPAELDCGSALTIANKGKAALVELPVHTVPMGAEHLLEQLLAMGLTPVIAHPERNSELRRTPERLGEWVQMGCLGQVTVQSCTGRFGEVVQQSAKFMVQSGYIHVAASDAHRDRRRVPELTPAREPISKWTSAEAARVIIETYPTDLAAGRQPDLNLLHQALPPPKKSWWRRMVGE